MWSDAAPRPSLAGMTLENNIFSEDVNSERDLFNNFVLFRCLAQSLRKPSAKHLILMQIPAQGQRLDVRDTRDVRC